MYLNYSINQLKELDSACWEEACKQGNRFAPILIGLGYEKGTDGYPINLDKAEHYFNIAMERGEGFAASRLGGIYFNNDKKKALQYYAESVKMGWINALVNGAFILLEFNEYEESRKWLNHYFNKIENPSNNTEYAYACGIMARTYMHNTVLDDDAKEMLKYLKLGDKYGGCNLIDADLCNFYANGMGSLLEKDLDKAIIHYSKINDFYHIGKIYLDEYNDAQKALEFFEKAFREQNDKNGLSAAYEIVPMYCFPEFENIIEPNIEKAEFYCREILDKEILPSATYYVLGVLAQIYNNQEIDNYIIKERTEYLIDKYKCFSYIEQNAINEVCNFLNIYLETICFNYIALEQYKDINVIFDKIYKLVENSISELMPGYIEGLGTKEFAMGLLYLDNNMLLESKKSFEMAKKCGRDDDDEYLRRFSTSLFGKITFK